MAGLQSYVPRFYIVYNFNFSFPKSWSGELCRYFCAVNMYMHEIGKSNCVYNHWLRMPYFGDCLAVIDHCTPHSLLPASGKGKFLHVTADTACAKHVAKSAAVSCIFPCTAFCTTQTRQTATS
jgi:hypothetical protein